MTQDFPEGPPIGSWTLDQLRAYNRHHALHGGTTCFGCGNHVEVYNRTLNHSQAVHLLLAYRLYGVGVEFHSANMIKAHPNLGMNRDCTGAKMWGLLESVGARRGDGGHKGMWVVTELGGRFCRGEAMVPERLREFNGRTMTQQDPEVRQIRLTDALAEDFDLDAIRL